jgi:hypothetical protein
MSTCRWTGRPRSEWSASNSPIAPTIGPPASATRVNLAEAIAKPNQPVPARRETLAHRRMTPMFIPLWFGWALETGHRGGHLALFPGDCRNNQTRWRMPQSGMKRSLAILAVLAGEKASFVNGRAVIERGYVSVYGAGRAAARAQPAPYPGAPGAAAAGRAQPRAKPV